jgi:hypothetical protein
MLDPSVDRISIGRSLDNDLAFDDDPAVSKVHAKLERTGPVWCIIDLNSLNGTIVNGERILVTTRLADGDELLVGHTHLTYRDRDEHHDATTERAARAPSVTKSEREVLRELCRPVLSRNTFTEPATVAEIASARYCGEGAVKQHLGRLYDKFEIPEAPGVNRRVQLANEAIQRGAITLRDLKDDESDPRAG